MIDIVFLIPIIVLINYFLVKKKFLLNNTGYLHQTYNKETQIPLSGGFFILIYILYNYEIFDPGLITYLIIFFSIGLSGDLNLIKSPLLRFGLQIFILLIFLVDLGITINDVRIDWFNQLLKIKYFNHFFVLFCFLVLINGSNFIDGNNGITLGYFSIIFILLINLNHNNDIYYDKLLLTSFLIVLLILLLFNILNKLYLGDNGVYILSIFSGYIIIDMFNQNQSISPYFIVNIFWYPAFEILFSIIRKIKLKYSPLEPDTKHFHQLLFFYYKKNFKIKKKILNSFTGFSINLFNGFLLYFASLNLNNTKIQMNFLILSLLIYLSAYIFLLKFKNSKN